MNIGIGEIIFILILALLLFGAKRLPEIGRSLGNSVKEFKKGLNDSEGKELSEQDEQ